MKRVPSSLRCSPTTKRKYWRTCAGVMGRWLLLGLWLVGPMVSVARADSVAKVSPAGADEQARSWKSAAGSVLVATLVDEQGGFVTLKDNKGEVFRIHISNLSPADQDYILTQRANRSARPLSPPKTKPGVSPVARMKPGSPEVVAQMKPGVTFNRTAKGETGISYVVYVPSSFNTNAPPPLIIAFSPSGGGSGMVNRMKASAEKAGWTLIGCNRLRNKMNAADNSAKMEQEVLDDIFDNIPHDPDRIYLAGFSGGAMRAYRLSTVRQEPIAGIVAYGGWLGPGESHLRDYPANMAVAIINGKEDAGANTWVKRDTRALENRKSVVRVFVFDGGHSIAPSAVTDEAIAWLNQEWEKRAKRR